MTASTSSKQASDIARLVLESIANDRIEVSIAGGETNYRLILTPHPAQPPAELQPLVGKRIKGRIHGQAQRMFKAAGGGGFIEPIWGEPRIVAGLVKAVDQANRRVLVDVAVPMWLTLEPRQPADMFAEGDLVNCYVESGVRFERVK